MLAVDTNLIVRVLTQDDPAQASVAADVLRGGVWIPKSVVLEVAWVLANTYGYQRLQIADALDKLLSTSSVETEDRQAVHRAIAWFRDGLDFADALHLASSSLATGLATFDRAFARRASDLGTSPPVVGLKAPATSLR